MAIFNLFTGGTASNYTTGLLPSSNTGMFDKGAVSSHLLLDVYGLSYTLDLRPVNQVTKSGGNHLDQTVFQAANPFVVGTDLEIIELPAGGVLRGIKIQVLDAVSGVTFDLKTFDTQTGTPTSIATGLGAVVTNAAGDNIGAFYPIGAAAAGTFLTNRTNVRLSITANPVSVKGLRVLVTAEYVSYNNGNA